MIVVAHRGVCRESPENSFAAFDAAVTVSQRIELDIRPNREGEWYVLHDDGFLRTTGQPGLLSESSSSEVDQLELLGGGCIPKLDEVLERYLPNIELNLEVKAGRKELPRLIEKLESHFYREKVIVSSFEIGLLEIAARSSIQCAALWGADTLSHGPDYLSPVSLMEKLGVKIIHPDCDLLDQRLMDHARLRGWQVVTWAPMVGPESKDRVAVWKKLKDLGVHGHCTNYPEELGKWLKNSEAGS